ncbi:MAG: ATP-binding protein, partial [Campylobacterota bacterium]|nr:ATP-binding protein [Campylobacterota bacterium]
MDLRFNFSGDDDSKLGGFRLSFFEAYNWGTYNNCIVKLDLNCNNALLTGDIGSGKSTLVDALTTLIVPHQKIIYNKAAGANTKERTLSSYILGEYKSSQDEKFGNSKAIALRDNSNYSVLLAKFKNKGFEETLTIAQFFYINNNQVNKFFIVSQGELSIKKDFLKVETIKGLKKQLRDTPHTKVFDIFKDYSKEFRRVMGIKNDQALNLFYQTVSLKSIGNLTEFIRLHMLESNDIDNHIDKLCISFADLNHTHELIKKAKHQIELLEPINKDSKKYKKFETTIENLNNISDGLNIYFSKYQKELFEIKIKELNIELIKNNSSKEELNEEIKTLNEQITNQRIELKSNGGDRINQIENEIKNYTTSLQKAKKENESFNKIIKNLGYSAISNEHSFLHTRDKIDNEYNLIDENITKLENEIMLDNNSIQNYKSEKSEIDIEIIYLKNHPSNIPHKISKIRDGMADSLGIKMEDLPFVGELIKICDEQWCGAIERVLHSFALSLIVDISLYDEVSSYIENTNLKGKLVYLKVNSNQKNDDFINNIPNSLLEKLELKIDSPYYKWLNNNLNEKFNISCVDNMLDFRRFKKALTINGQYKSNLIRHEKDDRFNINDSSRWILGWNNLIKLEKFKLNLKSLEEKIEYL